MRKVPPSPFKKDDHRTLYSTTELAAAAGVTPRTVRFYEAQGLLQPQRAGITRVYTYRDRARLALIRRSKKLGFSLQAIAEVLELYNIDPVRTQQARATLDKARGRIADLEEKMTDLQETLRELRKLEQQAVQQLSARKDDRFHREDNGPNDARTTHGARDKGRHR
jgi:DNA-binding transcriptional MerR regulator